MKVYEYILRIKDQASDKVSRFMKNVNSGKGSVDRLGNSLQQASTQSDLFGGSLSRLTRWIGPAALGALLTAGALKASALAREFEQTRISYEVMIGSVKKGRELLSGLETMAIQTPFKSSDLQSSGKLLLGYGVSVEKILPTLRMLGDISGGNAEKLHLLSLAYAQSQAAGRLMGQDLLQMVNAGFNPLQTISEKTGISIGKLKEKMEDGAISAKLVEKAFKAATEEGGRFFNMMEKQSQTMEGRLNAIGEKWEIAMRGIGQGLNTFLSPLLDAAIDKLDSIMDKGAKLSNDSAKQTSAFRNLQTNIKPLVEQYEKLKEASGGIQDEKLIKLAEKIGMAIPSAVNRWSSTGQIMSVNNVDARRFIQQQEDLFKLQNREAQDEILSQLNEVQKKKSLATKLMEGARGGKIDVDKNKFMSSGLAEISKLSEEEIRLQNQLGQLRNDEVLAYIKEKKSAGSDWSGVKDEIMGKGKDKDGIDRITGGGKQAINVTINIQTLNGIGNVEEVNGEMEIKDLMKTMERAAVEAVTRAVNSANYAQQQ